tara:strand:- start:5286 stop:5507 length:222 start_codon:yes stop_codon:yes gene_type:complete
MKEFSKYIERIKKSLAYLDEKAVELKKVHENIKTIKKLEKSLTVCKTQSLENEELVNKVINDIDKLLLNKSDS